MSDGFSLGDVILSMFWFMLLFAWIWTLIAILSDILGDTDLSGWGKALWTLFLIAVPWLGALAYLIARGRSMNERTAARAQRNEARFRDYVRESAGSTSTADELGKLAHLRDRGAITQEDYDVAKARILTPAPAPVTPRQPA
jgi:hypothetical protein